MKSIDILLTGSAFAGCVMLWSGCSNEFVTNDDCTECTNERYVSVKISTPTPDKIVFPKSRAEGTPIHEKQEWALKTMNLYLFEKKSEGNYTLFKEPLQYSFAPGEQQKEGVGVDNGSGSYSLNMKVTDDMIGKTFKFVFVANEQPAATVTTTLADFLKTEAKTVLNGGESADVIVGNPSSDGATGFPMTAIAQSATQSQDMQNNQGSEDITIGYSDINITASMLRNVARIDFFNYTPNMVITGARLINTASKSYLFPQTDTKAPIGSTNVTLNPTSPWQTEFKEGVKYVTPEKTSDEAASRAKNTLKHVFYMYEQENTSTTCSAVEIDYKLTELTGGGELEGHISVPLKKITETDSYINPKRNYLYTIKLGDGTKVDNRINVADVIVKDWVSGGEITEPVNPDKDTKPQRTE